MTPLQWKRLFYRSIAWFVIILLGLLAVFIGLAAWRVYERGDKARIAHDTAQSALETLDQRKAALEESLEKLDTERGIEEEVRRRYQVVKPGEEVIILVNEEADNSATTNRSSQNFWESFLNWLR